MNEICLERTQYVVHPVLCQCSVRMYEGHLESKERFAIQRYLLIMNSVALVRERTIPTERPPPVGEVSANFCG